MPNEEFLVFQSRTSYRASRNLILYRGERTMRSRPPFSGQHTPIRN